MKIFLNVIILTLAFTSSQDLKVNPLTDDFIDSINNQQSAWRAGRNFDVDTPVRYLRRLAGVIQREKGARSSFPTKVHPKTPTPPNFDAREQWRRCASIGEIQDQGECASDWVMAAVAVMSDRICILTKGTLPIKVSAEDLLTCNECTVFLPCGCGGSFADNAWSYWRDFGIVTGGSYGSGEGCKSYSIPPCNHTAGNDSYEGCNPEGYETPECYRQCDNSSRRIYEEDLTTGLAYNLPEQDEEQLKIEIMTKGPIEAVFIMHSDFLNYKSGVYHHTTGEFIGIHAVKILGWGIEDDKPYWLAANSWNSQWGNKGYFKILRGQDECSIESFATGADPIL